ncbi:MAG: maleylpyruvate isomerase family mycothiol-dependent enzyme [Acidimicrobiia bacterium]|nr:maleylpyruvate isomerase family mycothiol-dependent enzyme [Acidimicrobiia bacterium]
MQTPLEALVAQHAELDSVLDTLGDGDWDRPSRCPGWSVGDIVLHLAQSNELAVASVRGTLADFAAALTEGIEAAGDADTLADRVVANERGASPAELRERYARSSDDVLTAFAEADPHSRVLWIAGEMSLTTLATTRVAETWAHTGDIAEAVGIEMEPGERLWHVCRLSWRTLPYAFSRAGRTMSTPAQFELTAPDGTGVWTFADAAAPSAPTVVRGPALDLCLVAVQRADAADTALSAEGPDAAAVLELVRSFA